MKNKEKQEAIKLRKEGLSLNEISQKLNVAKSSVSGWVRNIELSEIQKAKLYNLNLSRLIGNETTKRKAMELRINYQKEGQNKLILLTNIEKELYIAGCMLYWGEGHKKNNKNQVCFSNSDINMLKFFILFLKKCFDLTNKDISLYIQCYDDIHSVTEIENYWLKNLELDKSCLRKTMVNKISIYSQKKKCGKLQWGTCQIVANSTQILQQIYGAIQKIANFENNNWLMGTIK